MARAGEDAAAPSLRSPPLALSCTRQGKIRLLLYEPPLPGRTMCAANSPGPHTEISSSAETLRATSEIPWKENKAGHDEGRQQGVQESGQEKITMGWEKEQLGGSGQQTFWK